MQIPWREEDLLLLRTRPRDAGSAGLVATSLRLCPCVRVAWDRWDSLPGGREAGRARPRQVGLWRREPSRAPSARLWGHAMAPASWHQAGTRTLLVHAGSGGWHTDTAQSQSNQDRCERAQGLPGPAAPYWEHGPVPGLGGFLWGLVGDGAPHGGHAGPAPGWGPRLLADSPVTSSGAALGSAEGQATDCGSRAGRVKGCPRGPGHGTTSPCAPRVRVSTRVRASLVPCEPPPSLVPLHVQAAPSASQRAR